MISATSLIGRDRGLSPALTLAILVIGTIVLAILVGLYVADIT